MSSLKKMVLVPYDKIKDKRNVKQGYDKLASSPKKKKSPNKKKKQLPRYFSWKKIK